MMNNKFVKKPIIVEAFQMTKSRRWDNSGWPNWLHKAWQLRAGEMGGVWCVNGSEQLFCGTLEGNVPISFNDYIIQGVQDEIYPCKPDIFEITYEKVEG